MEGLLYLVGRVYVVTLDSVGLKITQCKSCELSFIWGKVKVAAQETSQIAQRNCSKEAWGWGSRSVYM